MSHRMSGIISARFETTLIEVSAPAFTRQIARAGILNGPDVAAAAGDIEQAVPGRNDRAGFS
jgi:hypothetical protein